MTEQGRMRGLLVLFSFLIATQVSAFENPCPFYYNFSQELGCREDNYLIRFGLRYCQDFVDLNSAFSVQGQKAMAGIRQCLIDHLQDESGLTCDNVEEVATGSHLPCYMDNHFCELPFHDQWLVLWTVRGEVLNPSFIQTMAEISHLCHLDL